MEHPIQAPPPKPPLRGRSLVLLAAITCLLVLLWLLSRFPPDSARSPALSVAQPAPPQNIFAIEPQYEELWGFAGDLSVVKVGSKYGFIDKSGKIVIPPRFDEADSFSEDLARIRIGSKYGFADKTGKIVINPQFERVGAFADDRARVKIGSKWGFIDKSGLIAIQPEFDDAYYFADGLARVKIGSKWGLYR